MTLKKKFSPDPTIFTNYATFLFNNVADPERARALLPRALQSLPDHMHVELTSKFAQLEFRTQTGNIERGRTVFEGLLAAFPRRTDLWNVLLDHEIRVGDVEQVRIVFRRALGIDSSSSARVASDGTRAPGPRLKEKQARFLFKKWLAWEEKQGDEKAAEEVKTQAVNYAKALKEG